MVGRRSKIPHLLYCPAPIKSSCKTCGGRRQTIQCVGGLCTWPRYPMPATIREPAKVSIGPMADSVVPSFCTLVWNVITSSLLPRFSKRLATCSERLIPPATLRRLRPNHLPNQKLDRKTARDGKTRRVHRRGFRYSAAEAPCNSSNPISDAN